MLVRIYGIKTRVCNKGCADSFKQDRQCGMNYGLHRFNGVFCLHREQYSLVAKECAYCGCPVRGQIPQYLKEKFHVPMESHSR